MHSRLLTHSTPNHPNKVPLVGNRIASDEKPPDDVINMAMILYDENSQDKDYQYYVDQDVHDPDAGDDSDKPQADHDQNTHGDQNMSDKMIMIMIMK